MKTQTKSNQQNQKKENQFVFIEYEKPTAEGHFMTVMDSYRNIIGRVHKSFNDQTKKFEYAAYDHAGKDFTKGEKLWEVKNEFFNNREQLLEQAHQRRIEAKEKSKENSIEKSQKVRADKTNERKNEIGKLRQGKNGIEKQNEKSEDKAVNKIALENNNVVDDEWNQYDQREQELGDLRNENDEDRGEMDLDR